jgi:hypothetical protein
MGSKPSLLSRWQDYQPSKGSVAWICVGCVIATVVVGFTWGGWVRDGTAHNMALRAADSARADVAAVICVDRFVSAPDSGTNLASLKDVDPWKRNSFIDDAGWTTLPGAKEPVTGAANLCVERLMDANLPLAKAAGASG